MIRSKLRVLAFPTRQLSWRRFSSDHKNDTKSLIEDLLREPTPTESEPKEPVKMKNFWKSDQGGTAPGARTEQKSDMIIQGLFESLMPPRDGQSSGSTRKSFQDEILSLWPPSKDPVQPKIPADVHMNYTLGTRRTPTLGTHRYRETEEQRHLREYLSPVTQHISEGLDSNLSVTAYFEEVILPRFEFDIADWSDRRCTPAEPVVCRQTAATLLNSCIRTLRHNFGDPMGAIYLFERSKRDSFGFFSAACTAETYNHMLEIRWQDYRDLYAVLQLATEIAINAIDPDARTDEILSRIFLEAKENSTGLTAAESLPLWTSEDKSRLDELNRYRSRFATRWASIF